MDLLSLYLLNLLVTIVMFTVLMFRAWVEHKNYWLMWKELEWNKTCETAGKLLKAEKSFFCWLGLRRKKRVESKNPFALIVYCALGCLEIDLLLGLSYVRKKL